LAPRPGSAGFAYGHQWQHALDTFTGMAWYG
jgi:hypothetical protein